MAIGLTRSKNLSESNLNLKTALQKLYAPGIERDIELFSLSSTIESSCFSGLEDSEDTQIFRLTTEKLRTITGSVLKRTKFSTRYFTYTDENKVYFSEYLAGTGSDQTARSPKYSVSGSIPGLEVILGGGGFYFLNSQDAPSNIDTFSGTWAASASSTVTITLAAHGFKVGQGVLLRFENSGGGTNATYGEYAVQSVPSPSTFTVVNAGGSISGSGAVQVVSSDIVLSNVQLKGKSSGRTSARADVVFGKLSYDYLPGTAATYSNTSFGLQLGSTAPTTITLNNHGLSNGLSVYIRVLTGTLKSGFVSSVMVVDQNQFSVILPVGSVNTTQSCEVCSTEELTRFTAGSGSRFRVKSIQLTDEGQNYIVPEDLEVVEGTFNDSRTGQVVKIRKQRGPFFEGMPEAIRTKVFTYTVKNATNEGFFLFDDERGEYLFVDRNTPATGLTEEQSIRIRRFDGVNVNNLLQFRFAQSPLYLRGYAGDVISLGASVSGAINNLSNGAQGLKDSSRTAIQNTRRPTPADSEENIFGYTYNSFAGKDVVIWQRVVMRDQDFILDPNDTTLGANSITGDRLRTSVSEFVMGPLVSWSSTASGAVTITLVGHSVQTGNVVRVSEVTALAGNNFPAGNYVATYVSPSAFSIATGLNTVSSGTLSLIVPDPNFQIRTPGLFLKVGSEYRRAFSTTDKPFFQSITDSTGAAASANPTVAGSGASFTGQSFGALSAEGTLTTNNPAVTNWYSYNTTISELAQRIHTNGRDGAFYYHIPTAPAVGNVSVIRNNAPATIYAVPLFTLAP